MSRLYHVDAFTDVPFRGNPAAVCLLATPASDEWMQSVAAEMNLSETAFVSKLDAGHGLRWFTPIKEVRLCGHATLAAAHVLWEEGLAAPGEDLVFQTLGGRLAARRAGKLITLDFPARRVVPADDSATVNAAIGAVPASTSTYTTERGAIYLLEYETEAAVRGLTPDFGKLLLSGARAVIVTSRSTSPDWDFVSRYFAPAIGVDEDPVTGTAHACLAPYWAAKLGKGTLVGYQASARGGMVHCTHLGDRVHLAGSAVTVAAGELRADFRLRG
jgi:PhzF family phenazine biosynthesis protein